ncbi:MAG: hypothetical protein AAFN42_02115 [Cyanobacteria bacterium J06554_1]
MGIVANAAHQIGAALLFSTGLLATVSTPVYAACLPNGCSQNGLLFSEASSSFKITDVTGLGTTADPFVVYQDVWGLDISLAISGLTNAKHQSVFNRPGFAISIVSRNLTGAFWRFYDHELQETAGYASGENDGLSFGQGIGPVRPYTSDRYARADEVTDVRDFINFYQGTGVSPGEYVRFNYFVTDTIPNHLFYIRQRPDYRTNATPTSAFSPVPQTISAPAIVPIAPPTPNPPEVAAPQPSTIQPSTIVNKPTSQSTAPTAISQAPTKPQSIPEPGMPLAGFIAILFGKPKRQYGQRPYQNHRSDNV